MRLASPGAALGEENHAIRLRIEEAAVIRHESRARTAVQKDDRLAVRRAALLVIKFVDRRHADVTAVVWFDLVVKSSSCFHIATDYQRKASEAQAEKSTHAIDLRIELTFERTIARWGFDVAGIRVEFTILH